MTHRFLMAGQDGTLPANHKAQVFIETTLGIIILVFLLFFIARIFVWFNLSLVERQEQFEEGRRTFTGGSMPGPGFSHPQRFHVFPQEERK